MCRAAPKGAKRRASTRAERTIERSERPALEGTEMSAQRDQTSGFSSVM